ncbi:MAG TPA: efflux RND transporter periplasmic adaptor subunit [Stellaceae bacterium]|nr:efflux RND transporter periplasmic adaptor subunit [Stellaceae bacterium]
MKRALVVVLLLVVALGIGVGGYWIGRREIKASARTSAIGATEAPNAPFSRTTPERAILYYRDPMGKPEYSPVPKKDAMGMDFVPVYEGQEDNASPASASAPPASQPKGRILYYRNPMGLADTSPVPKKDSMGMEYIPVLEGEDADDAGTVKISPTRVQTLGVRTAPAELRKIARTIRAVGTVQADERRLFVVNTKFEGWIEKLHVNATGQSVRRGEPLMEIYAPDLVVAEQEYLLAWRSLQSMKAATADTRDAARQLAEAALTRLRNWDIPDDQVRELQRSGKMTRTLSLRAPADGVVLEKTAVEGMRFMPGEPLYRIADLSTVWLIAEVFEQDLGALRAGEDAKITVNAYPGAAFDGKVSFIYPTVSQETRTGKVRIVTANTDRRLKPGMYANVTLDASIGDGPVLVVPDSAIIDSGNQQIVLVERGEGKFEPRQVKLGAHAEGSYEVRDGLSAGERVVVSANFLIDAESNLKAALKTFAPPEGGTSDRTTPPPAAANGKS